MGVGSVSKLINQNKTYSWIVDATCFYNVILVYERYRQRCATATENSEQSKLDYNIGRVNVISSQTCLSRISLAFPSFC